MPDKTTSNPTHAGGRATRHQVEWVAEGLRRAAGGQGVDLPVAYSRRVATEGLAHEAALGVTRLGAGVVIHTAPRSKDQLPVIVGYADDRGQWHRDGSRHIDAAPVDARIEAPAGSVEVTL